MPDLIRVHRTPIGLVLEIDGETFPFLTARDGWQVRVHPDEIPSVTITLVAETVEVVNQWPHTPLEENA